MFELVRIPIGRREHSVGQATLGNYNSANFHIFPRA